MQQFSRVLAAIDFSKPARGAFEYALALSQRHGAELVVVHAVPADQPFNRQARERLALAGKLARRADRSDVRFRHTVQQGDPAKTILLHARSLQPDLIVVGTHQRSGIERLASGSVAERVAAGSTAPVLSVPHRRRTRAVEPFSHLAVAVDFSEASARLVEQAMAIARRPGDRITLLHVVPGFSAGLPRHLHHYGVAEFQAHTLRDAWRRLQLAVPAKRQTPAAIHLRVLVGDTTGAISRGVESIGADLLLVGVPRRGVFSRALFGTTAARLLRAVRIPVLAVPGPDAAAAHGEPTSLALAA